MKKLSFEKICSIIAFIFLIGSFFNLVPIKYNKSNNNKSDNNYIFISISKDLNKVLICNYNKNYNIWCTEKSLGDIKNLNIDFFKQ